MAIGGIEMSQTQVHIVGVCLDRSFESLDLPFLFEDHDHVSRVLDGEIGDNLCERLSVKSDLRGLAFTYSGGHRIIGSNTDITNLTELMDTNLLAGSYVGEKMFNDLGVKSVRYGITDIVDSGDTTKNNVDAIETTYIRFNGKNVIKTNHSMFMTTILTSNRFFNSLTEEEQEAFKLVAKKVAKLEREWSIAEAKAYEQNAVKNGVKIVELNKDDQARLRKIAKNSYRYIKDLDVDSNLIKNIINAGKK
jgi:TRAP-type C4-dicarboxylate transport system substrate-binding protein